MKKKVEMSYFAILLEDLNKSIPGNNNGRRNERGIKVRQYSPNSSIVGCKLPMNKRSFLDPVTGFWSEVGPGWVVSLASFDGLYKYGFDGETINASGLSV